MVKDTFNTPRLGWTVKPKSTNFVPPPAISRLKLLGKHCALQDITFLDIVKINKESCLFNNSCHVE